MYGRLWVDVEGAALHAAERDALQVPEVYGVVLFARNFKDPAQLGDLTAELRELRAPRLRIAVDHEGGRVQRFTDGFTRLPSMARVGALEEPGMRAAAAHAVGVVIASELRAKGLDLSFAPVLDLAVAGNLAIGERAFHRDAAVVSQLALALGRGLNAAGFPAVGKHFPGHGSVVADSHVELPVDERALEDVLQADLVPFAQWARAGAGALMTAHLRFPRVAPEPVTFSSSWLQAVLRDSLGFDGVVFSDDLGMQAAREVGAVAQCAVDAVRAGCDWVLVCNDAHAARAAACAIEEQCPGADLDASRQARIDAFWQQAELAANDGANYEQAIELLRRCKLV